MLEPSLPHIKVLWWGARGHPRHAHMGTLLSRASPPAEDALEMGLGFKKMKFGRPGNQVVFWLAKRQGTREFLS